MPKLHIDIWSDIACPWCHVGKRRLEKALESFAHRDSTRVRWRAFELDPSAPKQRDPSHSYVERLAKKYRTSATEAQNMIDRMVEVGQADGLEFRFDRAVPGNTFDAHRVLHLAHQHGVQDAAKERLFRAYMTEGEALFDHEVLVRLASEVGLDADLVRATLVSDALTKEVRHDESEAQRLGIRGVPLFLFHGRLAISGAQPAELLHRALEFAWAALQTTAEPAATTASNVDEAAACGLRSG